MNEPEKEYAAIKARQSEIEQEKFKIAREEAELEQKLIVIKAKNRELFQTPPSPGITGRQLRERQEQDEKRNRDT